MNRTIAATTVAAACALTTPALAQGVTMYGHGSWKGGCGEWARITATNSIDEFSYTSWLLGYLSAVNELVPGIDDVTGGRANVSVLDWMKLWCRNHPLDQTANAANALIKADNPKMTDAQIAFAIDKLKQTKALDGGDAAAGGIGIMTAARWKQTYDFLVAANLLDPKTEWQKAFTDRFVKDLKVAF